MVVGRVASKIGNDFFVFHKFPFPSILLLPPCPTDVPLSLFMPL